MKTPRMVPPYTDEAECNDPIIPIIYCLRTRQKPKFLMPESSRSFNSYYIREIYHAMLSAVDSRIIEMDWHGMKVSSIDAKCLQDPD